MARRFASAFMHSVTPYDVSAPPWLGNILNVSGAAGGIALDASESSRVYIAPSCYSEVRKVVFWAVIRHGYTGTAASRTVRLRVTPSSTSATARVITSAVIGTNTIQRTFPQGAPGIWSVLVPTVEAGFYDPNPENQNEIQTIRFTTATSQGSQVIYQEFDRFEAADAAFFSDWDAIASLNNNDRHIAYGFGVQRNDGANWLTTGNTADRTPMIVACGFAIVQAPSANNRTRIYLPCTQASSATAVFLANTYGSRACPFFYNAAEWSGTMQMRMLLRQYPTASVNSGTFLVQLNQIQNQSNTTTQLFEDTFTATVGSTNRYIARSREFSSLLTDGMVIAPRFRADTGTRGWPYGCYEITLTGFNVMTAFFPTGMLPATPTLIAGGPPTGTPRFDTSSGLFDPLWFEDFETERFLEQYVQIGLLHLGASNQSVQQISANAVLEDDVSVSAFNVLIDPQLSSTPNATIGFKLAKSDITSNNPLNVAGQRKLTTRYAGTLWTSGGAATFDYPGSASLAYVINVPNEETTQLGPVFDVGAFNPEGCASTSAGLGEPGVLVITNGASIPKKFNPSAAGTTAEIEDCGIPTPFAGEVPTFTTADMAASPTGGLNLGLYRYRYTFRNCCTGKESDPNPEDIEVDTTGRSPAAQVTLSFAGVRIPADAQICEICVYRTLEGGDFPIMAKVGCFNPDDTSTFVDRVSDDALDFTTSPLSILNAPMPCVPIVVEFRNRLFGMGDIPNLTPAGTVSVVNGEDIIYGDGDVVWDRCLEGKLIRVGADCRTYEILRVLPPDAGTSPAIARLQLTAPYEGTTDTGLTYIVAGRPNRLYFSEPLEPEYWPAANFLDVESGDGDRIMGAASNFDRLVICKRRKTYVLTFRENPGIEVYVPSRISSDIGCIGPRTFAQVESGTVWLAERGLALFDGRSVQHIPESVLMNRIFVDPDDPNYVRRDRNGRVIEAVGVFYPGREQYLLLLPTVKTDRGCSLMLVWDTKLRNITLVEFYQQFLSMTTAKDAQGNERVYLGDANGFVWIYDVGDTDGVGYPNATGTVRGDVTGAGIETDTGASYLDCDTASFIEGGVPALAGLSGIAGLSPSLDGSNMGLAGATVLTRRKGSAYDDPWTARTVYAATSTRLYVTPEWGPDTPFDSTGEFEWEFMLGAIGMDCIFKPQNYGIDDTQKRSWRQIVVHEVEQFASQLRIDLLPDFQMVDPEADTVVDPVTGETGEGRVFRMDYARGRQIKPVGRDIHNHMAVRMRNLAPEEPIRIINHVLCEEPRSSK